jgi:hypothetical protein
MKKMFILLSILMLLSVFLMACSVATPQPTATPSETPLPTLTLTPVPSDTPRPTSTPVMPTLTPTPTLFPFPEIKIPEGNLIINKVELTNQDAYEKAPDGKQFLTIWFVRSDGMDIDVVYFLKIQPVSPKIYLVSSDGTRNQISGFGSLEDGKLFIRFTVSTTQSGFQFFWPDNPLIDLGL